MRVRFQADADLDGRILRGLRRAAPEIDIRTAVDAALAGLKDPEVLRIAADAKQFLSPRLSKSSLSFGARARPRNGKAGSFGFRFTFRTSSPLY